MPGSLVGGFAHFRAKTPLPAILLSVVPSPLLGPTWAPPLVGTAFPTGAVSVFACAALVALGASAVLVARIERISDRLHLSEAMLGLTVALAADSPEIASAITASSHGQTGIGAGVILGSNAFNLAALLGLGAIVAGKIALHRSVVLLEGLCAIWVASATVLVVATGIEPVAGLALVLPAVVPYVALSALPTSALAKLHLPPHAMAWIGRAVAEEEAELSPAIHPLARRRFDVELALLAVATVVVASAVMEHSAESIGAHFHLSSLVTGGVVLAAITSLPNAVGAVYLAAHGRGAACLSEAMNSNMLNVLVGYLLPGIILGLDTHAAGALVAAAWYGGLTLGVVAVALVWRGMSRSAGFGVVAAYAAFVVVAITTGG